MKHFIFIPIVGIAAAFFKETCPSVKSVEFYTSAVLQGAYLGQLIISLL